MRIVSTHHTGRVLAILATLALAGCFKYTEYIDLSYPTNDALVAPTEGRGTVALVVTDKRVDRARIGHSTPFQETSFLTADNVEVWIFDAFRSELKGAGLKVVERASDGDSGIVGTLHVDLRALYCYLFEFRISSQVECEVDLTVTVHRTSGEIVTSDFRGAEVSPGVQWLRSQQNSTARKTLGKALRSSILEVLGGLEMAD